MGSQYLLSYHEANQHTNYESPVSASRDSKPDIPPTTFIRTFTLLLSNNKVQTHVMCATWLEFR
ncbi:unnamed protein product [Prunus brigantina]